MERLKHNWHQSHLKDSTVGEHVSDIVVAAMGSWKFIIMQSALIIVWITLNVAGWAWHWDPYPFILLNLVFSTQAFYAAPIIMMSQNRQADRDRAQATADYHTNLAAKEEIEQVLARLNRIELDKLDRIITLLEKQDAKK